MGAQNEAADSFRVWFCPVRNPNAKKVVRRLRKSDSYQCRSATEASALVEALRARSSTVSAGRTRNFHVFLNPVSGPGK